MKEVPAVLFHAIRRAFERGGVATGQHLEGLALAKVSRRLGERVDWDELATFINRCAEGLDPEELERFGELYVVENAFMQAALHALPPRLFFASLYRLTRIAYPHLNTELVRVSAKRLLFRMRLPTSFQHCLPFFQGTIGEFKKQTAALGLTGSVDADVGPRHGDYFVPLPELEASVVQSNLDSLVTIAADLTSTFELALGQGRERSGRVLRLQSSLGLTRAEARIAARLAAGQEVGRIAEELRVSVETVRSHLKRAFTKANVRRQADLVRVVLMQETGPSAGLSE